MRCPKQKKRAGEGELFTPYYEICPKGGEANYAFTLPMKTSDLTYLGGDLYSFIGEFWVNGPTTLEERKALNAKEAVYESFEELPFYKQNQGIMNARRSRLYIYNRKTAEITPVSTENEKVTHVSHEGTKLVYAAAAYTNTVLDEDVAIYLYDAVTWREQLRHGKGSADGSLSGGLWLSVGRSGHCIWRKGRKVWTHESPCAYLIDPKTKKWSCSLNTNTM